MVGQRCFGGMRCGAAERPRLRFGLRVAEADAAAVRASAAFACIVLMWQLLNARAIPSARALCDVGDCAAKLCAYVGSRLEIGIAIYFGTHGYSRRVSVSGNTGLLLSRCRRARICSSQKGLTTWCFPAAGPSWLHNGIRRLQLGLFLIADKLMSTSSVSRLDLSVMDKPLKPAIDMLQTLSERPPCLLLVL